MSSNPTAHAHEAIARARAASGVTLAAIDSDRARCEAILEDPEARGRERLARHIAFATNMSPDLARRLLRVAGRDSVASEDAAAQNNDDQTGASTP